MNPASLLTAATQAPKDLVAPAPSTSTNPREAAKQFEGFLMANLFQELRKSVHPSGLFGDGGNARATYEYLLDQAVVTHAMDAGRTWGLTDKLEVSLKPATGK